MKALVSRAATINLGSICGILGICYIEHIGGVLTPRHHLDKAEENCQLNIRESARHIKGIRKRMDMQTSGSNSTSCTFGITSEHDWCCNWADDLGSLKSNCPDEGTS